MYIKLFYLDSNVMEEMLDMPHRKKSKTFHHISMDISLGLKYMHVFNLLKGWLKAWHNPMVAKFHPNY